MNDSEMYPYDVFVSYCEHDEEWVQGQLLPRLQKSGLDTIDASGFEPGAPRVTEIERAALQSRKTVLVLSPAYIEDEWAEYGQNIIQTLDPSARKRRLIPIIHERCKLSLRIRPLVTVDLTTNNDTQWQRLLEALDPSRPQPANLVQNISLAITEPTSSMAEPGWHRAGSVWLLLSVLILVLIAGLVQLLLHELPALRSTVIAMIGTITVVLGYLGVKEDRDFFRRLSHFVGQSRATQVGIAALLAATLLLWYSVGWPALIENVYGPLGRKEPGEQRIAFGEFVNLTPNKTEDDELWAEGTRRSLSQKLSRVSTLKVVNTDSPQATERTKRGLDFWIEGDFQMVDRAVYHSRLATRGGQILSPDIRVEADPIDTESNLFSLQDDLAFALLDRLGINVSPDLAKIIRSTPTNNPQAFELNNEGVLLLDQKEYVRAEETFRAALALDPDYSEANANLGFVFASQGEYDAAVVAYQSAINQLPEYAPYHYNLGTLFALMGQEREALISLEKAVDIDSGYVQAFNELGNLHIRLEQWDEAREVLERGLALNPDFAPLSKNLARVSLAEGKADEALELLQAALQLYEETPLEVVHLMAEAYAIKGEEDAACQQIATFQTLDPNLISEWAPAVLDLAAQLGC